MKNWISLVIMLLLASALSAGNSPYPIIFVHGLIGSDKTFEEPMLFLQNNCDFGDINVFDIVLNADNETSTATLQDDVKWEDFGYQDFWHINHFINVGRRNFADDIGDFVSGWTPSSIYAINFKEERIRGASGYIDFFDESNQSAIFKQGYALGKMIEEVLNFTGAEKVILVGHSMGGLAIREYLQRTEDGSQNSEHVWWVNPEQSEGHHVEKVVTIGTPHLGSNSSLWDFIIPGRSGIPDLYSESVRDIKRNYAFGLQAGIYLFGGAESLGDFWSLGYDNFDVNCDGYEDGWTPIWTGSTLPRIGPMA